MPDKTLCYPGTEIPVRAGDKVRWYDDEALSEVVFVIGTGDFPADRLDAKAWFTSEFGSGIMIDTPSAGWVLIGEDCACIALVESARRSKGSE